ncbi:hypothetical protein BJF90_15695 [Pseudonocardia sp. CNS-004]|nr:hypothetical protein BJF90_15695 [Pseudonocardia sp. CNS-004]
MLQRTSSIVSLGHRLLLTGPPGVGKRKLALSACALHHPDKNVHEYDAADAGEPGWLEDLCSASKDDDSVVLVTHLDLLDTVTLHRFCRWVDQSSGAGLLLATFTVDGDRRPPAVLTGQFPHLLELPPLADRVEDIAPIAEKIARGDKGDAAVRIDAAAMRRLTGVDWRANVRQLEQAVRAARSACPGSVVRVEDLPELCFLPRSKTNLTRLQRHERDMIIATLAAEGGNKKAAAASLGISRSTLYRKLVAFGLGG